jgi:hypothetical protein
MNTDNSRPSARSTEDVDAREDCQRQPSGTHTLGWSLFSGFRKFAASVQVSFVIAVNTKQQKNRGSYELDTIYLLFID